MTSDQLTDSRRLLAEGAAILDPDWAVLRDYAANNAPVVDLIVQYLASDPQLDRVGSLYPEARELLSKCAGVALGEAMRRALEAQVADAEAILDAIDGRAGA